MKGKINFYTRLSLVAYEKSYTNRKANVQLGENAH